MMESEESALRKAILAEPDDDIRRWVYADWLEEQGRSAQAEFIRVQIQLDRNTPDHPDYRYWEDREHGLLGEHEGKWFPERDIVGEWIWRRGFVETINLTPPYSQLPEVLAAIADQPVTHLALPNDFPPENPWPRLSFLPLLERLRTLDLSGIWMPERMVNYFTWDQMPHLRALELGCRLDTALSLLSSSPFSQLESVTLIPEFVEGYSPVESQGILGSLCQIRQQSHIQDWYLPDCHLDDRELTRFLRTPSQTPLRSLTVSGNLPGPHFLHWLTQELVTPLRSLDVFGTEVASDLWRRGLGAPGLSELESLDISLDGLRFTTGWHDHLFTGPCKKLKRLIFRRAHVEDDVLETWFRSEGPDHLEYLDLGGSPLGRSVIPAVLDCTWLKNLRYLDLSLSIWTAEDWQQILKHCPFPKLRQLNLHEFHELEPSEIISVLVHQQAFPELRRLNLSGFHLQDDDLDNILETNHWELSGLCLSRCENLLADSLRRLARSPKLARLNWLDLSHAQLNDPSAIRDLAESPYLSPLCELDLFGLRVDPLTLEALRTRLGPRLSH